MIVTRNVFVTYTPFHLLVACGLARQGDDNVLVSIGDFPDASRYRGCIERWPNNPFETVMAIDAGMQFAICMASFRSSWCFSLRSLISFSALVAGTFENLTV